MVIKTMQHEILHQPFQLWSFLQGSNKKLKWNQPELKTRRRREVGLAVYIECDHSVGQGLVSTP